MHQREQNTANTRTDLGSCIITFCECLLMLIVKCTVHKTYMIASNQSYSLNL